MRMRAVKGQGVRWVAREGGRMKGVDGMSCPRYDNLSFLGLGSVVVWTIGCSL